MNAAGMSRLELTVLLKLLRAAVDIGEDEGLPGLVRWAGGQVAALAEPSAVEDPDGGVMLIDLSGGVAGWAEPL